MEFSPLLTSEQTGDVFLKLEMQQITGSFKLRGATNAVLNLSPEQKDRGVVGVSTGNYGRSLVFACKQANVKCIICMSELVPQNKIDGIKALGAELRVIGRSQDDAQEEVDKLVSDGMTMLPPFDHPDIIAGQGTLALEILDQCPEVDTILVPLSGGGLISGIALVAKAANPDIRIIGVSMERGCAMYQSLKAGKPIFVEELPTLADSLGGGIGLDNQFTFSMVREYVDGVLLVSETEIAAAIHHAYWNENQIIEGSGSVGIAALLADKVSGFGTLVSIISGKNIDMALHNRIINGQQVDIDKK
jgi:threonine dehydratase